MNGKGHAISRLQVCFSRTNALPPRKPNERKQNDSSAGTKRRRTKQRYASSNSILVSIRIPTKRPEGWKCYHHRYGRILSKGRRCQRLSTAAGHSSTTVREQQNLRKHSLRCDIWPDIPGNPRSKIRRNDQDMTVYSFLIFQ